MDLGSLLQVGESTLGYVKSVGMPLGFAKKGCGIGSVFPYTAGLSQRISQAIKIAKAPSSFSSLALDSLKLARSFYAPIIDTKKMSKLALSILKRGCDLLRWLEKYHFITLEATLLGHLDGIAILRDLTKASLLLWKSIGDANQNLVSISKILKSSLLIYSYLADDKRVKVVIKGIGLMNNGYFLYQQCNTLKSQTISRAQLCQIISSIALAALALYVIKQWCFQK
jgi:hypothetical protein